MYRLIYRPGPGEGPEPKKLGGGFDITVTPNKVFETRNAVLALGLVDRVKRITPADKANAVKLEAARAKIQAAAEAKAAAAAEPSQAELEAAESIDPPELPSVDDMAAATGAEHQADQAKLQEDPQ